MAYEIETGIPIQFTSYRPQKKGRHSPYPFSEMAVGDSFLVKDMSVAPRARSAAHSYGTAHELSFITRITEDGLRIWRFG